MDWEACNQQQEIWIEVVRVTGFPGGSGGKESTSNVGDLDLVTGLGDPLEEGMATHSSILPGECPWTEVPGGLQAMGSQSIRQG